MVVYNSNEMRSNTYRGAVSQVLAEVSMMDVRVIFLPLLSLSFVIVAPLAAFEY